MWGADTTQAPGTVYPCADGDCGNWESFLRRLAGDVRASGLDVRLDIWNEPAGVFFPPGFNTAQYYGMWDTAARVLREELPGAPVVGPSLWDYSPGNIGPFLDHAKAAGTVPDILNWHFSQDPVADAASARPARRAGHQRRRARHERVPARRRAARRAPGVVPGAPRRLGHPLGLARDLGRLLRGRHPRRGARPGRLGSAAQDRAVVGVRGLRAPRRRVRAQPGGRAARRGRGGGRRGALGQGAARGALGRRGGHGPDAARPLPAGRGHGHGAPHPGRGAAGRAGHREHDGRPGRDGQRHAAAAPGVGAGRLQRERDGLRGRVPGAVRGAVPGTRLGA
ncbi:conserved hypothetical protein [Streptomyces sp. SPB074]|nr:conserved hypothetical protein [Streptomyces sp. SPB074]